MLDWIGRIQGVVRDFEFLPLESRMFGMVPSKSTILAILEDPNFKIFPVGPNNNGSSLDSVFVLVKILVFSQGKVRDFEILTPVDTLLSVTCEKRQLIKSQNPGTSSRDS